MSFVHKSRELNEMTSINSKKAGIIGIVGVALALLVAPLSLASADGGFGPGACVQASSDEGKFVGQAGGCQPASPEPVDDCATSDEAVSAAATAQAAVARLNSSRYALTSSMTKVLQNNASPGVGYSLYMSNPLPVYTFTLKDDDAIASFCEGADPLGRTVVAYSFSYQLSGNPATQRAMFHAEPKEATLDGFSMTTSVDFTTADPSEAFTSSVNAMNAKAPAEMAKSFTDAVYEIARPTA